MVSGCSIQRGGLTQTNNWQTQSNHQKILTSDQWAPQEMRGLWVKRLKIKRWYRCYLQGPPITNEKPEGIGPWPQTSRDKVTVAATMATPNDRRVWLEIKISGPVTHAKPHTSKAQCSKQSSILYPILWCKWPQQQGKGHNFQENYRLAMGHSITFSTWYDTRT